ncbi:hypothetical protein PSYMO_36935, partial [Pseudomonas amygdali pv. mori str. 301020]
NKRVSEKPGAVHLMDTMISRQSFGLLWLNPPYGDLVADHS